MLTYVLYIFIVTEYYPDKLYLITVPLSNQILNGSTNTFFIYSPPKFIFIDNYFILICYCLKYFLLPSKKFNHILHYLKVFNLNTNLSLSHIFQAYSEEYIFLYGNILENIRIFSISAYILSEINENSKDLFKKVILQKVRSKFCI